MSSLLPDARLRRRIRVPLSLACALLLALVLMPVAARASNSSSQPLDPIASAVVADEGDTSLHNGIPVTAQPVGGWPAVVSQSAVVMDLTTGTVVYAKSPLAKHYPASLTKILTAMIALQRGHLSDRLTASASAVNQPPDKLYQVAGETESLKKLLSAMMVNSDNDVAVEIAQNDAGSVARFADWMNQEAESLGATHSHFVNPSGLPNPNHYTTAYDMAVITRAAMQNSVFRSMVSTKYDDWKGTAWSARLVNLNSMLFSYPGAIGVKTGYTSVAHETLAVAARHGHTTFLAVLLDAPFSSEINTDATNLLNYAFGHYRTQQLLPAGTRVSQLHNPSQQVSVPVITTEPLVATVRLGTQIHLRQQVRVTKPRTPLPSHAVVGRLTATGAGQLVSVPVALSGRWSVPAPDPPTKRWAIAKRAAWAVPAGLFSLFLLRRFERKLTRRRRLR